MTLRIGSLFSGYGGLEIGIAQVLDARTVWHSEIERAPSRILEHHWPTIPNLGDVTAIDWATAPPVDVLCGGFPCQDVSLAGLRRGLRPDTRSGLWSHFAAAIDGLHPQLVVIENVRGLLSAEAHSDLEPDPWDLAGPERLDRPALRALGAVLGDLADLGYDADWLGLRAADAGAPHGRFRVFIVARPAADTGGEARRLRPGLREGGQGGIRRGRPHDDRLPATAPDAGSVRRGAVPPAHDGDGPIAPRDEPDRRTAADPERARVERWGGAGHVARPAGETQGAGDQREQDGDAPHDRGAAPRDWGPFAPAVRRWEGVLGRVAPGPTDVGPAGAQRLAPPFVEWMMGLESGHVTAPEIGLKRAEQLKALGNGVVPQQAALAIRTLLGAWEAAEHGPDAA